jgi:hypothetical protein
MMKAAMNEVKFGVKGCARLRNLERKPHLQFQPAVIRGL